MYTWLKTVLGVTVATLLALSVWGCFGVARHLIVAVDKLGDAGEGLAGTAARLNDPQKGTIKMLDEDVGATKSLIIHADLVARHEQQSLNTWDDRVASIFDNINGGVTDLRGTIQAATGTVSAVQGTANASTDLLTEAAKSFRTLNDPSAGLAATLANANGGITDLRTLTPEVKRTVTASANTMEHVNGIAGDGHKVADHYEQVIDNPKGSPWYIRALPDTLRIAAQAAIDHYSLKK